MGVLAVIPCLNEVNHLEALLAHLLADREIDRIIVADGGSTDGSREIVVRFSAKGPVTLLDNPDRIQGAGVNRAVRRFGEGYKWLLRVDAHCLYPANYASILLEAAELQHASAVVVPMVTKGRAGFERAAATAQNSILGTGGSAHRHLGRGRFVDHGHHALIDMALFRSIGGYCEAMSCNEDAELDHRLGAAGGTIWLEPKAVLTYFPRSSMGSLWRQYLRYGQGRARNLRRHRMRPKLRQMIPLFVPFALALSTLAPFNLLFALPAAGWLGTCLVIGMLAGWRVGGGWAFAAGLAAAVMQLSWALGFIREWVIAPSAGAPRYGLADLR